MKNVYEKVASSVVSLGSRLEPDKTIMPIGIDGAVVYHFLRHYWSNVGAQHDDQLQHVVHATSKKDYLDRNKFSKLLDACKDTCIYGVDLRTKTGLLGAMLREEAFSINTEVAFLYAVLFDLDGFADLRGTGEELTDEQRSKIFWLPTEEAGRQYINRHAGSEWHYALTHEDIAGFGHVQEIKNSIDYLV